MQIEHEYSENLSLLTLMSAESIRQSSHQNYRSQIRSDAERRRVCSRKTKNCAVEPRHPVGDTRFKI